MGGIFTQEKYDFPVAPVAAYNQDNILTAFNNALDEYYKIKKQQAELGSLESQRESQAMYRQALAEGLKETQEAKRKARELEEGAKNAAKGALAPVPVPPSASEGISKGYETAVNATLPNMPNVGRQIAPVIAASNAPMTPTSPYTGTVAKVKYLYDQGANDQAQTVIDGVIKRVANQTQKASPEVAANIFNNDPEVRALIDAGYLTPTDENLAGRAERSKIENQKDVALVKLQDAETRQKLAEAHMKVYEEQSKKLKVEVEKLPGYFDARNEFLRASSAYKEASTDFTGVKTTGQEITNKFNEEANPLKLKEFTTRREIAEARMKIFEDTAKKMNIDIKYLPGYYEIREDWMKANIDYKNALEDLTETKTTGQEITNKFNEEANPYKLENLENKADASKYYKVGNTVMTLDELNRTLLEEGVFSAKSGSSKLSVAPLASSLIADSRKSYDTYTAASAGLNRAFSDVDNIINNPQGGETALSQISTVFNFIKNLDNSVVRPQEYKSTLEALQSWIQAKEESIKAGIRGGLPVDKAVWRQFRDNLVRLKTAINANYYDHVIRNVAAFKPAIDGENVPDSLKKSYMYTVSGSSDVYRELEESGLLEQLSNGNVDVKSVSDALVNRAVSGTPGNVQVQSAPATQNQSSRMNVKSVKTLIPSKKAIIPQTVPTPSGVPSVAPNQGVQPSGTIIPPKGIMK